MPDDVLQNQIPRKLVTYSVGLFSSLTFSLAFPRPDLILLLILFFSIPRVVFEISDLAVDFLKLYKLLYTLLRSGVDSRDGMEL